MSTSSIVLNIEKEKRIILPFSLGFINCKTCEAFSVPLEQALPPEAEIP